MNGHEQPSNCGWRSRTIDREQLRHFERMGYVAQLEFRGLRTRLELSPSGVLTLTEDGEPQPCNLSPALSDAFESWFQCLGSRATHVFRGVLLRLVSPGVADVFVASDILGFADEPLEGMTMMQRYDLLDQCMGTPSEHENTTGHATALLFVSALWLVENVYFRFADAIARQQGAEIVDGLVLKRVDLVCDADVPGIRCPKLAALV